MLCKDPDNVASLDLVYVLRYIDKEGHDIKKRATRTSSLICALVSFPIEATEHTLSLLCS